MLLSSVYLVMGVSGEAWCRNDQDCGDVENNMTIICSPVHGCILLPLHLNDPCVGEDQCSPADANSECNNYTCQCKAEYVPSDMGHCVPPKDTLPPGFIALCVIIPVAILMGFGFIYAYRKSCAHQAKEPEAVVACEPSAPVRRASSRPAPLPPVSRVSYSTSQGVAIQGT